MDLDFFINLSFVKDGVSSWQCPSCEHGRLRLLKDSIVETDDARTRRWNRQDEFDPRDGSSVFSARWTCDNKHCLEQVHVMGDAVYQEFAIEDQNGELFQDYELVYRPKVMIPPLRLFSPPKETPASVVEALVSGFGVAFLDANAAANQLRTAVEILLDELKVPSTIRVGPRKPPPDCPKCGASQLTGPPPSTKSKTKELKLHERIERLPRHYESIKAELLAVKWLGNAGSHASGIDREHMITGYAIMEKCLSHLYDGLQAKVKAINKHGGPVPKAPRLPRRKGKSKH